MKAAFSRLTLSPFSSVSSLALMALLSSCDQPAPVDTTAANPMAVIAQPSPAPQQMQAWFGDLHLHTGYSFDAAASATNTTPDDAYRYAKGEAVPYFGRMVQRRAPLDFLAVTDHAEYLGVAFDAQDPTGPFGATAWPQRLRDAGGMVEFLRFFAPSGFRGEAPIEEFIEEDLLRSNWQRQIDAAQAHYQPGEFTSFVAFEWSPMLGGAHLHRNVIFRGPEFPELPYSAIDSRNPEDLWRYAEAQMKSGKDLVLIPHNANLSQGLMFAFRDYDGEPLDEVYAQRRSNLERLVEITQIKGTSETRPEFSPTDEFSNFELLDWDTDNPAIDLAGGFVRTAYQRGLQLQEALGTNPFNFGLVGSSDFHSGVSSSEEYNYPGGLGDSDEQSDPAQVLQSINPLMQSPTTVMSASGLTGVWAPENTREALFDALKRREVFATSGPRLQVRFFAGWHYPEALLDDVNWERRAYDEGVPMGADLRPDPAGSSAPRFVLQALKDPDSGNLDRIQIIKLWLQDGQPQEKIFDVLWSGERVPDPASGKLPAVGNTVDPANATWSNSIGAVSLAGTWTDPEFNAAQAAIYYARVIEIPTPRWTTYLAVENDLPLSDDVPVSIQERAWTSPIFYTP